MLNLSSLNYIGLEVWGRVEDLVVFFISDLNKLENYEDLSFEVDP